MNAATAESTAVVVFHLGEARFGLEAGRVREIVRAVAMNPFPQAPPIVEGAINWRGEVVPVLDIRKRFGLAPAALDPSQHLLIASSRQRLVALRVDQASEVITIARDAIVTEPADLGTANQVAGVARLRDGVLIIHDLDHFLATEEARQLDTAVTAARVREGP